MCSLIAIVLSSCGDDEITQSDKKDAPITFASSQQEEQSVTRADSPLAHDFTVWGYKKAESDEVQKVFQGYTVRYVDGTGGSSVDNTHGYSYVDEEHNQSIKYWDFFAREYNFWGATMNSSNPSDPSNPTFSSDGTTLTISGLAQSVTEPVVDGRLFSALYHREPPSRDVVRLQFKRPYAKVRVMFYTNDDITDNTFDNVKLKNITFAPDDTEEIATEGKLSVKYLRTGKGPEEYSTDITNTTVALSYKDVTLDHNHGTASNNAVLGVPTGGTEYYFVVPNKYTQPFILTATIDDKEETAVIPVELMNWKPNFSYTYLFKVSGGRKVEFYDVQVEPWHYGGSQKEEWKNW